MIIVIINYEVLFDFVVWRCFDVRVFVFKFDLKGWEMIIRKYFKLLELFDEKVKLLLLIIENYCGFDIELLVIYFKRYIVFLEDSV